MDSDLVKFKRALPMACVALVCLLPRLLAQQGTAVTDRRLEGSMPPSNLASSNYDAAVSEPETRRDLRDAYRVKKPDSFNPIDPYERTQVPIMRPPTSLKSKKLSDLLLKNKDWVFLEPNEKEFGLTPEDIFKIRDKSTNAGDTENLSPIERFYHRAEKKENKDNQSGGKTNRVAEADKKDEERQPGLFSLLWGKLSGATNSSSGSTVQPRDYDSDTSFQKPNSFAGSSGFFSSSKAQTDADDDAANARKARMDGFKSLLDTYYSSPSGGGQGSGGDAGSWFNTPDPWRISSPRPAVSSGPSPPTVPKNPFNSLIAEGLPPGLPQAYPESPIPSAFPSLTPELPLQERRRMTMPEPAFTRPTRNF